MSIAVSEAANNFIAAKGGSACVAMEQRSTFFG